MARSLKIFGRQVTVEQAESKRLLGVGKDDEYIGMASIGDSSKSVKKLDAYRGLVYSCINRIADSYASYSPYLERRGSDKKNRIDEHPFLQLLRRPAGTEANAVPYGLFDLLFATSALIELQGDAYWYIPVGESTRKPKEIIVLRADKVGKKLDEMGEIESFYVRSNGSKIVIPIYEMIPFIGFNPKDAYSGLGTTEANTDYIETEVFSTKFTKNFFKNNAGISGILTFSGLIAKGVFKKAVRLWRDKYQGVDNAGKVMMVRESEAKFTKIGLGLNELDMSSLRKMSREDIALAYGVPLPLLGKADESGLGRAAIETLEYIFAKYTIEPKLVRLDSILQFALERYFQVTDLIVKHDNIIPEDKEYELNQNDKGVDRWITRNEIRRKAGLPEVDGGDYLRSPIQNMPIEDNIFDSAGATKKLGTGLMIKIRRKTPVQLEAETPKKKDSSDSVAKENFRLRLMKNQIMFERLYKRKFNTILVEQRKEALFNLEAHASSLESNTKALGQKLFDDGAADEEMQRVMMPVLKELGEDQGALALLFAGDDTGEFIMNAGYEKIVRESTKRMASNFNDYTLDALNRTLGEGIQAGENLQELSKRVEDVYDGAKGARAERVARTETLKASNTATNEAYRQTGYVKEKQWYVNPGACNECLAFEGKTIELDDSFLKVGQSYTFADENGDEQTKENTYDDVDSPPLHPNCRCTIIPIR